MPGALIWRHSIRVQAVQYEVEGWGVGELYLSDDRLLWHELPAPRRPGENDLHPLAERFRAYFAGERDDFADVELDLEWATPFQRAVADTLRAVPYGEVVTYGELAALAGRPNAQRAAGTFCAGNRFPLVLPCHRVVAAGGLGSYGSLGTGYKRRLLRLEGVRL
jgi:methylated-DNA-[protein]-cysteine S-methyltransferase